MWLRSRYVVCLLLSADLQVANGQKWHNTSLSTALSASSYYDHDTVSRFGQASSHHVPKANFSPNHQNAQNSGTVHNGTQQPIAAKSSRWPYAARSKHWSGMNGTVSRPKSQFASSGTLDRGYWYYQCTISYEYDFHQPASAGLLIKPLHPWHGKPWVNSTKKHVVSTGVMNANHKLFSSVARQLVGSHLTGDEREDRLHTTGTHPSLSVSRSKTKASHMHAIQLSTTASAASTRCTSALPLRTSSGGLWWPSASIHFVNGSQRMQHRTHASPSDKSVRFQGHKTAKYLRSTGQAHVPSGLVITRSSVIDHNTTIWTVCSGYGAEGGSGGGQGPGWMPEKQTMDVKEPALTSLTTETGPSIKPSAPAPLQEQTSESSGASAAARSGFQALTSVETPILVQPAALSITTSIDSQTGGALPLIGLMPKLTSDIIRPPTANPLLNALKTALQKLNSDEGGPSLTPLLAASVLQAPVATLTFAPTVESIRATLAREQGQAPPVTIAPQESSINNQIGQPRVQDILQALNGIVKASELVTTQSVAGDAAIPVATVGSATIFLIGSEVPTLLLGSSSLLVGQVETYNGLVVSVQSTAVVVGSSTFPFLTRSETLATPNAKGTSQALPQYTSAARQLSAPKLFAVLSTIVALVRL